MNVLTYFVIDKLSCVYQVQIDWTTKGRQADKSKIRGKNSGQKNKVRGH